MGPVACFKLTPRQTHVREHISVVPNDLLRVELTASPIAGQTATHTYMWGFAHSKYDYISSKPWYTKDPLKSVQHC